MNPLNSFYNNQSEREGVKAFLIESLKELAVERAFEGKSVVGIAEAKEAIDGAFNKLEEMWGKKPQPVPTNSR